MTRADCLRFIAEQCDARGIDAPSVIFIHWRERGSQRLDCIRVPWGRNHSSLQPSHDIALHELAHYIHWRESPDYDRRSSQTGRRAYHGHRFCSILWELAEAFHGDPTRFDWAHDYQQVNAWAQARMNNADALADLADLDFD